RAQQLAFGEVRRELGALNLRPPADRHLTDFEARKRRVLNPDEARIGLFGVEWVKGGVFGGASLNGADQREQSSELHDCSGGSSHTTRGYSSFCLRLRGELD